MTSGYQVQCAFFIPADPHQPDQMADVSEVLRAFKSMFAEQFPSFEAVTVQHKFISRRTPRPAALAAEQVEERAAQGQAADVYNRMKNQPTIEQPDDIPAGLRRA